MSERKRAVMKEQQLKMNYVFFYFFSVCQKNCRREHKLFTIIWLFLLLFKIFVSKRVVLNYEEEEEEDENHPFIGYTFNDN